jgi:hypothetical protein
MKQYVQEKTAALLLKLQNTCCSNMLVEAENNFDPNLVGGSLN